MGTTMEENGLQQMDISSLVERFIKLRDRLKEADDAHKERTKAAREYKELLEGALLQRLQVVGGESIKTAHGTVYRTSRKSASIADGAMFRNYVIQNNAFDLVDWRANSVAVGDFIKTAGSPPPGVNYSQTITVGVRRA